MHESGRPPGLPAAENSSDDGIEHENAADIPPTTRHVDLPFVRVTFRAPEPLGRTALAATLDTLPNEVARFKGLVRLEEHPDRPYVLQGVGRRWSLEPAPPNAPATLGIDDESVIDFIGIGPAGPIESAAGNFVSIPESSTQSTES